jgi:hypothetical protein
MLAERFMIDGGGHFRIGLGEGEGHAVIHTRILGHGAVEWPL